MLIGNYHHTIEQKGRLAIPVDFRESLGDEPVITRGVDHCLYLLPFNSWSKTLDDLKPNFISPQKTRDIVRLLTHHASRVNFDSQGRILVPQVLRDLVGLQKKVLLAGSHSWVEIWDIETYKRYTKPLEDKLPQLVESLYDNQTI